MIIIDRNALISESGSQIMSYIERKVLEIVWQVSDSRKVSETCRFPLQY